MKIIFHIIVLTFSVLSSQVFSDYSYTGTAQTAMAGSIGAEAYSENGLFQNPASMAGIDDKFVIAGQSNIFNQSYLPYQYLGLIYKMPIINNVGISFRSLSTKNSGVKLSSENALSFSKGILLQKDKNSCLAVGFRINALFWEQGQSAGASGDGSDGLGALEESAIGFDFGIIGGLRDRYWVGGYLSNINSPIIGSQNLPRKISISLGFSPFDQVYTNLSMERLLGRNDRQVKLGFKYNLDSRISLLFGAQSNPNRFGLGFEYSLLKNIVLSYSILTHHVMSETHSIEIKIR